MYVSQEGPLMPGPWGPRRGPQRPRGAHKGLAHKGPARKSQGGGNRAEAGPQGPGPHGPSLQGQELRPTPPPPFDSKPDTLIYFIAFERVLCVVFCMYYVQTCVCVLCAVFSLCCVWDFVFVMCGLLSVLCTVYSQHPAWSLCLKHIMSGRRLVWWFCRKYLINKKKHKQYNEAHKRN